MDETVIHHVYANRSNIGDWLSARGIQQLLAPCRFQEHLCDEPFVEQTLDELSRTGPDDFVIIGGGGLFMGYFAPFWQGFADVAGRTPFGIWGAGYCDLKLEASRPPQRLLEEIVAMSRFCHVRDELTRRHLVQCALPPAVGCPSIAAIEPAPDCGWGLVHVDNYTTAGPGVFDIMDQIGRDFAQLTDRPYHRTNNRIQPGRQAELEHTLDRYRHSDVVLSSALHGCIIGAAMGKKVVAVSGDWKIESFMQAMGWERWVVDCAQANHVRVLLQQIGEQPDPRERLMQMTAKNEQVAADLYAMTDSDKGIVR